MPYAWTEADAAVVSRPGYAAGLSGLCMPMDMAQGKGYPFLRFLYCFKGGGIFAFAKTGMPLQARHSPWSRCDWPCGHLTGHHLPNTHSSKAAALPLAVWLIPGNARRCAPCVCVYIRTA
jgi:hypothetical protein